MSVRNKVILGAKWTTLSTVTGAIASILKLSILARFLDRSDFGLMALVTVVLGFLRLFMDMGVTSAILHFQLISKKEYSSLYWLNFFVSIILMMLIIVIAPFFAEFYQEPELKVLLYVMSTSLIISALGRQFKTIEQKQLNFKFLAKVEIFSVIVSLLLAIVLAILGFGVYTLVFSALAQFFISNVILLFNALRKFRIIFHFKIKETYRFLKIGIYQVGGQTLNYFSKDIDTLLVGKLLGTEILGSYSLAKQLAMRPASILTPIISTIATPALALYQDDKNTLRKKFLNLLNATSTVNFVAYLFLATFAYYIVYVLYGTEYTHIYSVVQLLCIYMFLRSVANATSSLIIATGKTHLDFKWNFIPLMFIPLFVYIGSHFGIIGIAASLSIFTILSYFPYWYLITNNTLELPFKTYFYYTIPNFRKYILILRNEIRNKLNSRK